MFDALQVLVIGIKRVLRQVSRVDVLNSFNHFTYIADLDYVLHVELIGSLLLFFLLLQTFLQN